MTFAEFLEKCREASQEAGQDWKLLDDGRIRLGSIPGQRICPMMAVFGLPYRRLAKENGLPESVISRAADGFPRLKSDYEYRDALLTLVKP
jgi:hypothetical protein